ncbi:MAG TPA: hypothetical protein VFR37_08600 [Longimicrobium sp.]|nr:hypothetical protein [Longimicrobium sp.]
MTLPPRLVALLCMLLCQAGCAQAQETLTESARAEAARIEAELAEIESRALHDPELRRMDQALGQELLEAMLRADPGLAAAAGRLPLLQDARARAVDEGDAAAAAEAAQQIDAIERRYLRAQRAALRHGPLAERVDRFHTLLRRRMVETEEAAESLLRRYAELQRLLDP